MPTPTDNILRTKLAVPDLPYCMTDITAQEIRAHVTRLKKQKAMGPDEVPMETFKELDEESMQLVAKVFNYWWNQEYISKEYLRATVCLIFKKGTRRP